MAWRVMIPKKIPAMFSHEYPVGVMCRVIRWLSGFAGHLRSLGACPSVVVQHGMQPCAGMGGGGPLREAQDLMAVPGAQAFVVVSPRRSAGRRHRPHRSPAAARTAAHPPAPRIASSSAANRVLQRGDRALPAAAPLAGTVGGEAPCHPGNRRVRQPLRFQHTAIWIFGHSSPLGPNSRAKGIIVLFCAVLPVLSAQFRSSDGLFRHRYCG